MDLLSVLAAAAVIGLLPAWIAYQKGHSFWMFWLLGAVLWIVAMPAALLIGKDHEELRRRAAKAALDASTRACPNCGARNALDAALCASCQQPLGQPG